MNDEELIAFLKGNPRSSLRQICDHFCLPWTYSAVNRSPDGMDYGYTPEAKRAALRLQRLRKARKIKSEGQRWSVERDE